MWFVVVAWFLGSHADFFVNFFHQSWSNRTYPVLHPVICCDCWLEKTSRFFFGGWNFPIGMLGRRNSCWFIKKIHWFFEDSRPPKGPLVLLKGVMKPKCWKHFRFFLNQSYTQTKCWKFQVSFFFVWEWLNLIIHDISISSWILPPRCRRRRGRMHQRVPENPQMCKKKSEFRHSGNWFGLDVGRKRPWKQDPSNCLNWCFF